MDVVGDGLPFVVAGLEHSPKRLPLPLQSLLGLLAFGDVTEDAHRTGPSIVNQEPADDLRIEYASILAQ